MLIMRHRSPRAPVCAHQSVCLISSCICLSVFVPGICAVKEFEKFLEVLRSSDNDGLGGGDGADWFHFGLHHSFYETQPVKLH